MKHVIRAVSLSAALLLGGLGLAGSGAATAEAAPSSLGWLRVSPAAGNISTPIDVLSQARCPAGEAVVVSLEGPRIPTQGDLGYIVGNTAISALPITDTRQLYVPLSVTIRDWFGRNVPDVKPTGTYTLILTCRDKMRSSQTFGSYTARISISRDGRYQALGEAAKPLGIVVGTADPVASGELSTPTPVPGGTGTPSGSPTAPSSGTASPAPSSTATAGTGTPAGSPSIPESSPVAAAASSDAPGSSSALTVLVLGGAVLLVVAVATLMRRRSRPSSASSETG